MDATWIMFMLFVGSGIAFSVFAMVGSAYNTVRCYRMMWAAFLAATIVAALGVS